MRSTKALRHEGTKVNARRRFSPLCLCGFVPSRLSRVRYLYALAFLCGSFWLLPGCADTNKQPTTRPMSMQEKQDAMLRDPMGYKTSTDKYDISGGKINEFDKGAFKRDVDDVLNP